MPKTPYTLPLIIAGTALLVSIAAFRAYLPYVGDRLSIRQPPAIVLAMQDVYLVGLGNKAKLWSLNAERVEIGRDRTVTTLSCIRDGKIFDNGKPVLGVHAGRAVYDERRKDLKLSRGIEIEGRENQRVAADRARWNVRSALLTSPSRVTVSGKWGNVSGDGLVVDLRKERMVMRNVSFRVRIDELDRSQGGM